jgi:hypothetical protein
VIIVMNMIMIMITPVISALRRISDSCHPAPPVTVPVSLSD